MGQSSTGLYSLLGARSRCIKLHEWRNGQLQSGPTPSAFAGLVRHGEYLLSEAPSVPELWGSFFSALTQRQPLILLPPCSLLEREILLRQLPTIPPSGSVLVLFTSGTTGEPKAVFHGENSLLASARQLASAFPGSGPTCSLLQPWGMAGVMFHCLLPAARGGTDILFSRESLLNWAVDALRLLRELEVDLISLNPFSLEMLLRSGMDCVWAGKVVSLTAPLKNEMKKRFERQTNRHVLEIYGMSEAAGPVFLEGKTLGASTKLSVSGELLIQGEQLFLGYSANGKFSPYEDWFATGDIFSAQSGTFLHQARTRELIDVGGRKVAPLLIESVMEGLPEIAECLAFPKEISGLERPALVYVRAKDCALMKNELSALVEKWASEKLSPDLRPAWWVEVDMIPRTTNGKPDRGLARKLN